MFSSKVLKAETETKKEKEDYLFINVPRKDNTRILMSIEYLYIHLGGNVCKLCVCTHDKTSKRPNIKAAFYLIYFIYVKLLIYLKLNYNFSISLMSFRNFIK